MIKKTKNNLYIFVWIHKLCCDLSLAYHPNVKRGKRSKYDEMLKIIHPIIIKEKLHNLDDEEHFEYKFAVEKALRLIEEVSKIDESKKDYYNIYYHEYFKFDNFERFDIYDVADKYYCSKRNVFVIIKDCNDLVHKFIVHYVNNGDIVTKPYYAFSDKNIDTIVEKLNI